MTQQLPIAVIGGGPVGLATAAHLTERNLPYILFEAGNEAAASVRAWGHVRVFSPWKYVVADAAERLLADTNWHYPDAEALPLGHEIVDDYLQPLADVLAPNIVYNARVLSVARQGLDKTIDAKRDEKPFILTVQTPDGVQLIEARAVIDASGTYGTPNPIGANGYPAVGEAAASDVITYGIPDILGDKATDYAGKRVAVVGSGHSAFNALLDLLRLQDTHPDTHITWILRRETFGQIFGGGDNDELPARGALGQRLYAAVQDNRLDVRLGFHVTEIVHTDGGVIIKSPSDATADLDAIIATTGLRPNTAMLRELRLDLDSSLEAPTQLAPMIDPNLHSCGTVPPHGVDVLSHPEPNFYIVGMKSYGRAPTFLMLTGYEQSRSIVAALAGDWESARDVKLELPETGVCCTPELEATSNIALFDVPVSNVALLDFDGGNSTPNCC